LDQEGPYLHAPSGAYYARYRLNGKQRPVLLPIHSRKPDLINIASPSPAARR
jgi:hypothetical protein